MFAVTLFAFEVQCNCRASYSQLCSVLHSVCLVKYIEELNSLTLEILVHFDADLSASTLTMN